MGDEVGDIQDILSVKPEGKVKPHLSEFIAKRDASVSSTRQ